MSVTRRIFQLLRTLYLRMLRRQESARTREIADVLQHVALFNGLPRSVLREIAEIVHTRDYRRDEIFFYENDPGLGFYVVQRGRVRLYVEDEAGNAREVRQITKHECLGTLSLFGQSRRLATAQAVTETRVLGFFITDLQSLLRRRPSVAATVLFAIAGRLSVLYQTVLWGLPPDEGRLAALRLMASQPEENSEDR